jgi:hypothetical protein
MIGIRNYGLGAFSHQFEPALDPVETLVDASESTAQKIDDLVLAHRGNLQSPAVI